MFNVVPVVIDIPVVFVRTVNALDVVVAFCGVLVDFFAVVFIIISTISFK